MSEKDEQPNDKDQAAPIPASREQITAEVRHAIQTSLGNTERYRTPISQLVSASKQSLAG